LEAIDLTPKQIVERLDNYIIGQKKRQAQRRHRVEEQKPPP